MVDKYRYWKHEAIVADLDSKRHNFHIAIENWQHDLNIGTVVRTANAFLAKEVHIIGRRRWNRRGAMVTDRYQHVRHHPTVEDFVAGRRGRAGDHRDQHLPGLRAAGDLRTAQGLRPGLRPEGPGLTPEVHEAALDTLSIEQFGSTRSINAASAAAIAMPAWIRRHVFGQLPG